MSRPTETELLILNSIIYLDAFATIDGKDSQTVLQWANQFSAGSDNERPAEMTEAEVEKLVETIKANPQIYGNMQIMDVDNSQYANNDGSQRVTNATIRYGNDIIVVYKGTAGDLEWNDNGEGAYSNTTDTAQQIKALEYYDQTVNAYRNAAGQVYVTGHSKGGNKAQYVGVMRGDQIAQVVSFDGQGFNRAFLAKYEDQIERYSNKITNICNENDFVNILLYPIAGQRIYVKSNTTWGVDDLNGVEGLLMHKFGGWHSPYSMFERENGVLSLADVTSQSETMQQLQGLLLYFEKYMDEKDWRFLCYSIMKMMQSGDAAYGEDYSEMPEGFDERLLSLTKGYMEVSGNKDMTALILRGFFAEIGVRLPELEWLLYLATGIASMFISSESYAKVTRDFSESVKEQLLETVAEVEDEPFWDITRWDIFYRVESLLTEVDFPTNSEALKNYYRKIIDMNGTTKQEIERIFQEIYDLSNAFCKTMLGVQGKVNDIAAQLTVIHDSFL